MSLKLAAACGAALMFVLPTFAASHEEGKHQPKVVFSATQPVDTAVVETPKGTLIGEKVGDVNVFRGVPFAQPPVGDLRWKPPQPIEAWEGTKTAIEYQAPCQQPQLQDPSEPNGGGVQGVKSEDCLYLQVYAPAEAEKAPVVLWMHGGAFFLGAGHLGSYVGMENAKKGVITVPMNYRLGPMGYFAHPSLSAEGDATGSYGDMDAVAALEWIKENIESFGGDPENVTIAGQSAGGFLVMNLLSTPSAEGLFHKAVVQSGAGLTDGRPLDSAEKLVMEGLPNIGLPEDATAEQLRAVSAQTLVYDPVFRSGIRGTVDGKFFTTTTKAAMEAGTEIDVPVLLGSNMGEGGFNRAKLVAQMAGDEGAGAFLYNFQHQAAFRDATWKKGPIHSAELMYTFDTLDTSSWANGIEDMDAEAAYADLVSSCWVAFYKMDPMDKTISCADGFEWPAYTEANDAVAVFGDEIEVGKASELPDGPNS
ncbi:MAG: carboxylesterase [Ponticaulis sp.]|nr:carboxylesterase [Ponticaulis sp.]